MFGAVVSLLGSFLVFLLSVLPRFELQELYEFNAGGVDVSTIFGFLNWFVPVYDMGVILFSFATFITVFNMWLLVSKPLTKG